MASVAGKVIGGTLKEYSGISTVGDLASSMSLEGNYTAQVNGEPAEFGDYLENTDFVTFTKAVKGGS